MAKLPPLKTLITPEIPGLRAVLLVLNNALQSLWNALNRNLTFDDNIRSQIIELDFVGGSTMNISTNLDEPPKGLILLQVLKGPVTGGVTVVWKPIGSEIQIVSITGLTTGAAYRLRLLLI